MFNEDLDIFLAGEFSDRALFVRTGAGGNAPSQGASSTPAKEVSGIFDERYEAMFEQYSSTASGRLITFLITSAEADDLRKSDRAIINNKDYLIVALEPTYDGKLTKLVLKHG
jgi:hypothetical protein